MDSILILVVIKYLLLNSASCCKINTINDNKVSIIPEIKNILSQSLKKTLTGHNGSINSVIVFHNGDLAIGSADETIKIWDSSTGYLKRTLVIENNQVYSQAVLKNADFVSGCFKEINIWDALTASLKLTWKGHNDSVNSLTVLKNGDLASGSRDKTIKIWDSSTWELKRTLTGHIDGVSSLAVLQNGYLASGSWPNRAKAFWS